MLKCAMIAIQERNYEKLKVAWKNVDNFQEAMIGPCIFLLVYLGGQLGLWATWALGDLDFA